MLPNREEVSGWTTSASISETLGSLLKADSNDPIKNFRMFAFPALIRVLWLTISWIWVLSCVGSIIFATLQELIQAKAENQNQ